jgi:hypothetical protein
VPTPKARRAQITQRRAQAVELRCGGASWEAIAATLGYASRGAACTDVTRALDQRLADLGPRVDRLRTLALERLDATLRAVWPLLDSPDPLTLTRAAGTVVRVEERRAKLEGTDAPTRVAAAVAVSSSWERHEPLEDVLQRVHDRLYADEPPASSTNGARP